MKFSKLELIMAEKGINSLADIARTLDTTPQAVSNWKSRDQVPFHIIPKLDRLSSPSNDTTTLSNDVEESPIALSDILLMVAEQLKVIVLTAFVAVFMTFTYVQFIQQPIYESHATILLPQNKSSNLGGLAGIASQFGVNVPTAIQADLSSPSLFPDLISSRTFAEKILDSEF